VIKLDSGSLRTTLAFAGLEAGGNEWRWCILVPPRSAGQNLAGSLKPDPARFEDR